MLPRADLKKKLQKKNSRQTDFMWAAILKTKSKPSEVATSGALKCVQSREKQEQLDGVTGPRPVDDASVI